MSSKLVDETISLEQFTVNTIVEYLVFKKVVELLFRYREF